MKNLLIFLVLLLAGCAAKTVTIDHIYQCRAHDGRVTGCEDITISLCCTNDYCCYSESSQ